MASFRAVFVIESRDAVLSKRFPTVERRAKQLAKTGNVYATIPGDDEFAAALIASLNGKGSDAGNYARTDSRPVYTVGGVWPVVAVQDGTGHILACIPLVDVAPLVGESAPPIVKLPGVTVGIALMRELGNALAASAASAATSNSTEDGDSGQRLYMDLHKYISTALPFGSPLVVSADVVAEISAAKLPAKALAEQQPAWKPSHTKVKGKDTLHITIVETVRAVQYDTPGVLDVCDVVGAVQCRADVEGSPELTLSLVSEKGLQGLGAHHCVQSTEPAPRAGGPIHLSHRLRFAPPAHQFELCNYAVQEGAVKLPIRGFFQMKAISGDSAQMLIQLKVDDALPGTFDSCEARVPFSGRGKIVDVEANPGVGSVVVEDDGKTILWKIGQRKKKSSELTLPATVRFAKSAKRGGGGGGKAAAAAVVGAGAGNTDDVDPNEDPFCTGSNSFVKITFQVNDYSMGGCSIDAASVASSGASKVKINVTKRFTSGEYLIWNSLGKSRRCIPPSQPLAVVDN